jgi:hypothetical protein
MKKLLLYILISIFFWINSIVFAQNNESPYTLVLGEPQITTNTPFTVSVVLRGVEQIPVIQFPELPGFQKRGSPSREINPTVIAGKAITNQIITQNYYTQQEGIYDLNSFAVQVGTQTLKSGRTSVVVSVALDNLPLETAESINLDNNEIAEALLVVITDKKRVYLGEGFNLRLSLLVAESNPIEMEWVEIGEQLEAILKKIRPINCLEENFDLVDIQTIPIQLQGKAYIEYRIYQATFFPINGSKIQIPPISLSMKIIEKHDAKTKLSLQRFKSKGFEITVVPLPPHPRRNEVAVGNYRLEDKISATSLTTNNNYQYEFKIVGEGNLRSIVAPSLREQPFLQIYPPDEDLKLVRNKGVVSGQKKYSYQLIPQQNGTFDLRDAFEWIFFNPKNEKYDTLKPAVKIKIFGRNNTALSQTTDGFYDQYIHQPSSTLAIDYQGALRFFMTFIIVGMLIGMIYIFRNK